MRFHTSRKKRITVNCSRIAVTLSAGPPAHQRAGMRKKSNSAYVHDMMGGLSELCTNSLMVLLLCFYDLRLTAVSRTTSAEEDHRKGV